VTPHTLTVCEPQCNAVCEVEAQLANVDEEQASVTSLAGEIRRPAQL